MLLPTVSLGEGGGGGGGGGGRGESEGGTGERARWVGEREILAARVAAPDDGEAQLNCQVVVMPSVGWGHNMLR